MLLLSFVKLCYGRTLYKKRGFSETVWWRREWLHVCYCILQGLHGVELRLNCAALIHLESRNILDLSSGTKSAHFRFVQSMIAIDLKLVFLFFLAEKNLQLHPSPYRGA